MKPSTRMSKGEVVFQIILVFVISLLCIMTLYPFIHVLSVSFSSASEAIRPGIHLFPREFTLAAYKKAVLLDGIWIGFGNTIFRTLIGTALSVFAMSLGAYALSKKTLPHRNFITMAVVLTMFFSGGLIPTFLLMKELGLYDTRWALIIPGLYNTFYMLILRNFFMGLPEELEESAKIDGAHDLRILFQLILPLSKPILATISLWVAVHLWNEWFNGLIYIRDQSKIVLQIYLRRLIVENMDSDLQSLMEQGMDLHTQAVPESIKAAVLMIGTVPILLVYPFIQKYFVKGIMVGSLKG
ncbi:Inner membrane ABC transporter permease protein YcjP [Paenibacillus konkukensis]|uniref:Inner membrane ABC transporter permease protein YcjP n=1 Tax=Paenibacillus konkukensis TaxID=2020716 RepID=A0ABY4RYZ3_9BACL|nr:carbohydrate ABC transporter permease [Paenibacillus konkukensis]UQZ87537.1 Inner membrane ABC transporter permease protein YcjP [Paenibacillus konkukensis]